MAQRISDSPTPGQPPTGIGLNLPDSLSGGHGPSGFQRAVPYALLLGAGGALFAIDDDIKRQVRNPRARGPMADDVSDVVEHLGTVRPYLISMPLFAAHGLIFENQKSLFVAGEIGMSYLLCQGVGKGVKTVFGRKRPYEDDSQSRFFEGGTSFFSGHEITAMTFATVIAKNYQRQNTGFVGMDRDLPLVPVLMYGSAAAVAWQRVYSNNHWATDVYFGALAGYAVGSLTVHAGEGLRTGKFHLRWNGVPMIVYSTSFN